MVDDSHARLLLAAAESMRVSSSAPEIPTRRTASITQGLAELAADLARGGVLLTSSSRQHVELASAEARRLEAVHDPRFLETQALAHVAVELHVAHARRERSGDVFLGGLQRPHA